MRRPRPGDERRADSRHSLSLQVDYPGRQGYPIDFTESISPSGLLVRSNQHHRVGDEICVEVSLPGFPNSMSIAGKVARIREATAELPRAIALQMERDAYIDQFKELLSPAALREFSLSTGPYSTLATLPRIRLATLPTPLHRADRLSRALGGPEIWFKRDDLTGFAFGGNQVRKMELVAAHALQLGADTLIGGASRASSPQLRVMAAVAARLGLESVAITENAEDRLGLLQLFDTDMIERLNPDSNLADNVQLCMEELRGAGKKPYSIHGGDASWLGASGYVLATIELQVQLRRLHVDPHVLVAAVGTGDTMSGLLVGQRWMDCSYDVLGVSVGDPEASCAERVTDLAAEVNARLNIADTIPVDDVWISGDQRGEGYDRATSASLQAVRKVAQLEGILLDPMYSGKAMAGLIQRIESGELTRAHTVVFLHTGGSP